jgi:hypothetical protein
MDRINRKAIQWAKMQDFHNFEYPKSFDDIQDPFPEHTEYNEFLKQFSKIDRMLGLIPDHKKPKDISIWEAYQMGYEAAKREFNK